MPSCPGGIENCANYVTKWENRRAVLLSLLDRKNSKFHEQLHVVAATIFQKKSRWVTRELRNVKDERVLVLKNTLWRTARGCTRGVGVKDGSTSITLNLFW